ncbi:glycine-rich domain-containing protein [Mycobacterium xenopi]|uniref:glycine-rich domain-containing protein n=1 Tax=Mycobacterium xenopi TaxID=1789 RepID=UPI0013750391|nr:hypothetical protein [Mycobacterium xenopi]
MAATAAMSGAQIQQGAAAAALKQASAALAGAQAQAGGFAAALRQAIATLAGNVVVAFTPFAEENINRTNQPVPFGCSGCWVTLIGGGASGNQANVTAGQQGGPGGGRLNRVFIPAASLGSTYSVTRGLGATTARTSGGDSMFTSGSVALTAQGGQYPNAFSQAGGSWSATGISGVTGADGTTGGNGSPNSNPGSPGVNNPNNAGAGGGGGTASSGTTGGKGGDSSTVTGGAGGTTTAHRDGFSPADAAPGNGGAGGGGGGGNGGAGAKGGLYGGGGGGGAGQNGPFGAGGDGYTLVEWV